MRVVVTGGCGFVGAHLVRRLVSNNDVVVFDGVPPSVPVARSYVVGDVRDLGQLAEVITPGVDVVYHLAAVVGVDRYLSRPLDVIDVNFMGTRNVLELGHRVGAKVVVASTSEVFGKNPAVPWAEDGDRVLGSTRADRWTYSSSKALSEHMTFAFARQHGLDATVVRYFNVYGSGQRPAYIISRSIHRALNGLAPVVYDEGRQTRCFTYIDDAVEATVLAGTLAQASGHAFNLGSTVETSVADAVRLVTKLAGLDASTVDVDTAAALGPTYEDLSRRVPDTTKARVMLGWKAETSLQDGLTRTIEWARANPWWLALPDSGAS